MGNSYCRRKSGTRGPRFKVSSEGLLAEIDINRGPLALLLRRQYEFPFGINIMQFSFFFQFFNWVATVAQSVELLTCN